MKGILQVWPSVFSFFVWGCIFICSWTKKRICWEIWPPVMCIWDVCGIGCQPDIAVRCRRRYTDLYSIFRLPQFLGLCHCHFALIHHHDSTYLARQDDVVTDADVDNILQNDHSIFVKLFFLCYYFYLWSYHKLGGSMHGQVIPGSILRKGLLFKCSLFHVSSNI